MTNYFFRTSLLISLSLFPAFSRAEPKDCKPQAIRAAEKASKNDTSFCSKFTNQILNEPQKRDSVWFFQAESRCANPGQSLRYEIQISEKNCSVESIKVIEQKSEKEVKNADFCRPGDARIFSCKVNSKSTISLCANNSSESRKPLQYRFTTAGKTELEIPSEGANQAAFGRLMYAGGGGVYIKFVHESLEYFVFSRTLKEAKMEAGVYIQKDNEKIKMLKCLQKTTEGSLTRKILSDMGMTEISDPALEPDIH